MKGTSTLKLVTGQHQRTGVLGDNPYQVIPGLDLLKDFLCDHFELP